MREALFRAKAEGRNCVRVAQRPGRPTVAVSAAGCEALATDIADVTE